MQLENTKIEQKQVDALESILESLKAVESNSYEHWNKESTVLIHVDIVEGFLNYGALHSKKVAKILKNVIRYNEKLTKVQKLFVLDSHKENSTEFNAYPAHCVEGTGEDHLVKELEVFVKNPSRMIKKNSTNLFHAPDFKVWLEEHLEALEDILIVGDVTDICVLQAALSIQSYLHQINSSIEVTVIIEGVETFELDITHHDALLMNIFSLYNMRQSGIKLIKDLRE